MVSVWPKTKNTHHLAPQIVNPFDVLHITDNGTD